MNMEHREFTLPRLFFNRWGLILLLVVILLGTLLARELLVFAARATLVSLDPSFGNNGKVITHFDGSSIGHALALQPDGKIVVLGSSAGDIALVRYNRDGTLDDTFGNDGKVTTDFGGKDDSGSAIVLQPDGKIIVTGTAGTSPGRHHFALARYDSDGTLDMIFGTNGKVVTHFSYEHKILSIDEEKAQAIALQPDGKIIAAGGNGEDMIIARYTNHGVLDTTFATEGRIITDFSTSSDHSHESIRAITLQSDGKIIVGGNSNAGFFLARYNRDGTFDTTFGTNGKVDYSFDNEINIVRAFTIQPDGKIIMIGYYVVQGDGPIDPNISNFDLVRFNSNGKLDTTFRLKSRVTTRFSAIDGYGHALIRQPDGTIMVVGSIGENFALARYTGDGFLDITFGQRGVVATNFGNNDYGRAIVLQPDDKIIIAGSTCDNDLCAFALARYILRRE